MKLKEGNLSLLSLFSSYVVSDSWWPHGLQHARLSCPSLSSWVCSNSCPFSQWRYLTISSSAAPSPLAVNLSQHQSLFKWVGSSHQMFKVFTQSLSQTFHLISLWLLNMNVEMEWNPCKKCNIWPDAKMDPGSHTQERLSFLSQ